MTTLEHRSPALNTERFSILNPVPPFVDLCLRIADITPHEFSKIARHAAGFPNDARLIEMVRQAGDASAKVPYLLDVHETPATILETLREIARPHAEHLKTLPDPLRDTIYLLLSIHRAPRGCEAWVIAALLEMDRIQEQMIQVLRGLMPERRLAADFYRDNVTALKQLDRDWPRLRDERSTHWHSQPLPEAPQMEYHPLFDDHNRLVSMHETCVIVDAPSAHLLKEFTPPVLRRPLPESESCPETGSVDWLIRDVGKIGRHFTRALLTIIKAHLKEEQVALDARNYERIHREAQEALQEFVKKAP